MTSRERERLFELWAPTGALWSDWAKPVLFAHLRLPLPRNVSSAVALSDTALSWLPASDGRTIVVADLPGGRSVRLAEQLVPRGFRPVPLFNAAPGVSAHAVDGPGPAMLVDVAELVQAVRCASVRLEQRLPALPTDAPPIFLLHSERRRAARPRAGDFDNLSVSLPTDFPSARFLQEHGVTQVLLVLDGTAPEIDLAHTLLRWQQAGLAIRACSVDAELRATSPQTIVVQKPSWFGALFHNALSLVGLHRNPLGGFGDVVPRPSSG